MWRTIVAGTALVAALVSSTSAWAQAAPPVDEKTGEPANDKSDGSGAGDGAKTKPAKGKAVTDAKVDSEDKPTKSGRPDKVRFRGGFLFEGGGVFIPGSTIKGGAASAVLPSLHLGIQVNHLLGFYYENRPMFMLLTGSDPSGGGSISVGFGDHNILLASLTLLHTFELAAGGGVDFYALAGCGASATELGCGAGTLVTPGVHGKFAIHIPGWAGKNPGRSGFSIQASFHASIDPGSGSALLLPMGGSVRSGSS